MPFIRVISMPQDKKFAKASIEADDQFFSQIPLNLFRARNLLHDAEIDYLSMCADNSLGITELKLVYQLNPSRKVQHYVVEVFLFFASELASSDLGFYQNLWTTVELHTPKVSLMV